MSNLFKFIMFADDTTLACSGKGLNELLTMIEKELKLLKICFDSNELSLNISKTKFIVFGNLKKKRRKMRQN